MMYQEELFANYELDDSSWYKTVLKLFGGSLVLHVIIFLSLIYIPAVRDAFYVALLFSDAPMGWTNKDYEKTEIETATVINLPSADQLQYPAGYFELANGDAIPPDFVALTTPYTPEVVDTNVNLLDGTPPIGFDNPMPFPTPAPPVYTPLPATKPAGDSVLPKLPKTPKNGKVTPFESAKGQADGIPQPSPTAQTEPKKEDVAKVEPSPSPSPKNTDEVELNKKPWFSLGTYVEEKLKTKELDLNKPVAVTIEGELSNEGKIIGKLQQTKGEGDPLMVEIVSKMIAALDESEMLRYVKLLNHDSPKRKVIFNVSKDDKQVFVQILADTANQTRANIAQSLLNSYISNKVDSARKNGREETALLEKLEIATGKNQVVINWKMETPIALEMLKKKLAEIPKDKQPQSTSQTNNTNAQAIK